MKKLIIYLLAITALSCEKVVEDFDLKVQEPKVVINALAENDSVFEFQILKTVMRNNFSENLFSVNPSEIIFSANNKPYDIIASDIPNYYLVKDLLPKQGDRLDLNVSVKGLKSVSASTTIPNAVSFELHNYEFVKTKDPTCPDCIENTSLKMSINIIDPSENNYYAIEVISIEKQLTWNYSENKGEKPMPDTIFYKVPIEISSMDGIYEFSKSWGALYLNTDLTSSISGNKLYFKDRLLSGLKNKITISAHIQSYNLETIAGIPITIRLYTYDYNYYKYMQSLAGYNEFGEFPLSEPVYIHTNIADGRGILGSTNLSSRTYLITPGN